MSRLIVICTLLYALGSSEAQTLLEKPNFNLLLRLHSRNLFTVKIDDDLFSSTWVENNNTHVEFYSTNTTIKPTCSFDTRQQPFDTINPSTVLNAKVLGDNKIVVLGSRQRSQNKNDTRHRYDYYDLVLVDLMNCSYKVIRDKYLDKVPASFPDYHPQLIVYNDTFDMFFVGEEQCTPCRYNSKGEKIEVEHKLQIDADEEFDSFHVQLFDPMDTSRGYVYVYNFKNNTAVMKLLDENFNVVKEQIVNHKIQDIAVEKDVGAPIGFCYGKTMASPVVTTVYKDIDCQRLDFYMNAVLKPLSVPLPNGHVALNMTVTLDTFGNTFVAVAHTPLQSIRLTRNFAFFRFDRYGRLVEAFDFGHIDNQRASYPTDHIVQLDSYIVMGQYCLVVYEITGANKKNHLTHVKCIEAPTDDEMNNF